MAALHPESGLVAEVPAESGSGQYAHLRVHLVECGTGLLSAFEELNGERRPRLTQEYFSIDYE